MATMRSYRVKRLGDLGTRHDGPATIKLVNLCPLPARIMINFGLRACRLLTRG